MAGSRLAVTRDHIRQSNLIEDIDDPAEDERLYQAWLYFRAEVRRSRNGVTHDLICELNRRITAGQDDPTGWAGTYRDRSGIEVNVNGQPALAAAHVQLAMDDWLERFYVEHPKHSHIEFEKIHPFIDGNGRTGRCLMWYQYQLRQQKPVKLTRRYRSTYFKWFN